MTEEQIERMKHVMLLGYHLFWTGGGCRRITEISGAVPGEPGPCALLAGGGYCALDSTDSSDIVLGRRMFPPMPAVVNDLEGLPKVIDCIPGLWVELIDGWVVGPIVDTEHSGVYVNFNGGTWQVDVSDQPDVTADSSRLVQRVGPKEELCK